MTILRQGALFLGASILAVALTACSGGKGETAAGSAANSETAKAETLYKSNCMSCHGANLEGRVGPATNLQKIGGTLTKEQITLQIANGGGGMPMFKAKLKPEEIAALADWLSEKK